MFLTDSSLTYPGGSIGAGLFVGSGKALHNGGPGAVLLGFIIVGVMLLCTMQCLGELTVLYPVSGAFYTYIVRFVDPSLGFAVAWDVSSRSIVPWKFIDRSWFLHSVRPDC